MGKRHRSLGSHLVEATKRMRWCRLCNFVLKGHLPFSRSLRRNVLKVALWLAQRALAWVSGMLGSLTLVPQGPVPCLTHMCQIWEKQGNPRSEALTFLGFTFLIYGRKRLNKIKVFLHRVPGSGDKSVNLLTMLCKIVPLPCLVFQLLRKPSCICFCLREQ